MMRKIVSILTVILGIFLFHADFSLGTTDTPKTEAAPKISSVEPLFNFGEVKQGEKVVHVFQIQNTGTADIVINRTTGS